MKISVSIFNGSNEAEVYTLTVPKFERIFITAAMCAPMYTIWDAEKVLEGLLQLSPSLFVIDVRNWAFVGITHVVICKEGHTA